MAETEAKKPKSFFGRVGTGLAVALTGLGTALAGLSTGQMESAMYWRSLAAQDQARAASQWTLAGFKKTRAVSLGSSARTLRAVGGRVPLSSPEKFRAATAPVFAGLPPAVTTPLRAELDALLAAPEVQRLFKVMSGEVPAAKPPEPATDPLRVLLAAVREKKPAAETRALAVVVDRAAADEAIRAAELYSDTYDADLRPLIAAQVRLDRFVTALDAAAAETVTDPAAPPAHARAAAALLASTQSAIDSLDERIYDQETRISQTAGALYEARVAVSDVSADRYRIKSLYLFYALILVQTGAGIAALGGDRGALLVLLAVLIGLAGTGFAGYTYLSADPAIRGLG